VSARGRRRTLRGAAAALALASLALAAACGNGTEPRITAANPLADSADQVMFGVSTMITNQGVMRAQLRADTAYFFDGSTRVVVRHERTTFFTNAGEQNAVLTSEDGMYNMSTGLMEATKNVVVVTTDGKRLETSQLQYDQRTNLVTGDSAFVLTQPSGRLQGIGFISDPNLTNLRVKQVKTGGGTFTLPGGTE
jgi:LPS export ABC transporter protein LptC